MGSTDVGDPLWQAAPIPRSVAITKVPDAYSLDNFGSILYAMTSADSRLLMWDPAVGGAAVVQPPGGSRGPVPHGRCFVVTPERFLMIFGSTQDGTARRRRLARRFAWCDQENPGAWDYTNVTVQAGFLDIEPASPIICAHLHPGRRSVLDRQEGLHLALPGLALHLQLRRAGRWHDALVAAVDGRPPRL